MRHSRFESNEPSPGRALVTASSTEGVVVCFEAGVLEYAKEMIATLPEEARLALGEDMESLFISCDINNVPCDMKRDFTVLANPDFGNCYTFNFANSSRVRYRSQFAGEPFGSWLSL